MGLDRLQFCNYCHYYYYSYFYESLPQPLFSTIAIALKVQLRGIWGIHKGNLKEIVRQDLKGFLSMYLEFIAFAVFLIYFLRLFFFSSCSLRKTVLYFYI